MRKNKKHELQSFENSIKKSNRFSVSKLNQGLTLRQMQLFSYAIYCTQHKTTDFRLVDFQRHFGIDTYHYRDGHTDAKKLSTLQFSEMNLEEETFDFLNIFQRVKLNKGLFTVKWSDDILPHILELREHYVLTDLSITANFKSNFSWLLYDYLKAHHGCWYKVVQKDALLRFFVVENKKSYKNNTSLFKKRVLDVAIEEINTHTELEASYEEIKEGRKTVAFNLMWSKGNVQIAASEATIKDIERYISTIRRDVEKALDIDDIDKLKRIFSIGKEAIGFSNYVVYPPVIDKQQADVALTTLKRLLKELHHLIEQADSGSKFYNWLDEREE